MLIDWFTVGAQALNFLVLAWLLRRFLYHPVLDAVDARERRVAAELADADAKRAAAAAQGEAFRRKNEDFDRQRAALMAAAAAEAHAERRRLLDEARQAADAVSRRRAEALGSEARRLGDALARRTREEVFAIARKALADLASATLEERCVEAFARRLREMDAPEKATLGAALKSAAGSAVVRSAFELPAAQRAALQGLLNETFAAEISLRFLTEPDLVAGIELSAGGQKLAWSIAAYLASLEQRVGELLKAQAPGKAGERG
jgi:F-type H+-transporting ATPase subunit b